MTSGDLAVLTDRLRSLRADALARLAVLDTIDPALARQLADANAALAVLSTTCSQEPPQ